MGVAIYSEIAKAIRTGSIPAGELLPTEAELCEAFDASRSVVREALILLEEDGLVRTRRGVGRFASEPAPPTGLERLRPPEVLLAGEGGAVTVTRRRSEEEATTDFTETWLGRADNVTFWESLLEQDGAPFCIAQEWSRPKVELEQQQPALAAAIAAGGAGESMLSVIDRVFGGRLGPATCAVQVSNAGSPRGRLLGLNARAPVLVLTQEVALDGSPLYLAKFIARPDAVHLSISQTSRKGR
jgi:GntR family transcriptional regulator